MAGIIRSPESASNEDYDLIIIGGGIYGAMLCLEAGRRHLRALLLERDDFGAHTSFNSLRIVHGGLRYLQKLDLKRFNESVRERCWFLNTFPNNVTPLPCLMPLYGRGLHRPAILNAAIRMNDVLVRICTRDMAEGKFIPNGTIMDPGKTAAVFPSVETNGLKGGAVWYDAWMADSQRLLIDTLRRACDNGATALNYMNVDSLLVKSNRVIGVKALDQSIHTEYEFKAGVVVNAAGPWSGILAERFDRANENLFRPSLAWNILFNRNALSDHALAVTPDKPDSRTYFLVPWNGRLFAGTGHAPWHHGPDRPGVTFRQKKSFIEDLNMAIPGLNLRTSDIARIFQGLLPATRNGSDQLSTRPICVDHSRNNGPMGLFSISGVKFTTSRLVAEKTLNRIFSGTTRENRGHQRADESLKGIDRYTSDAQPSPEELNAIVQEESVLHLDDLVLRRTSLWKDPEGIMNQVQDICTLFDWDDTRTKEETVRLHHQLQAGGNR